MEPYWNSNERKKAKNNYRKHSSKERKEVTSETSVPLNEERCREIVAQYLQQRGWGLIQVETLSAEIWSSIHSDRPHGFKLLQKHIKTEVWLRYAKIMHNYCHNKASAHHERAWHELNVWLQARVGQLTQSEEQQENVVQKTLIKLQVRLAGEPLDAPCTLFAYALQSLRNMNIDLFRADTAQKRRNNLQTSLEELNNHQENADGVDWDELIADNDEPRQHEDLLISAEKYTALYAFFQKTLPTPLQRITAIQLYCEGLTPKEIAIRLNKSAHEVRMVKSRITQRLRGLPPEKIKELLVLLGRID